jgi:flagellar biosynthesis protein FlhA
VVFAGDLRRTRGNEEKTLSRETAVFHIFSIVFILCVFFGLVIFVAFIWLVLTKGPEIDSKILLLVSGFGHIDGIAGIIINSLLIVLCAVITVDIAKGLPRVTEVAARFSLDAMPGKIMVMECEYNIGEINEKTFIARKDNIVQQTDFMGAIAAVGKFVAGIAKIMIIMIAFEIFGDIIIGTRFHG